MNEGIVVGNFLVLAIDRPLVLRLFQLDGSREPQEINGGGYTPVPVKLQDWNVVTEDNAAVAQLAVREFRFDGAIPFNVAGVMLTTTDGKTIWRKVFPEPLEVRRTGDIIPVQPTLRLGAVY